MTTEQNKSVLTSNKTSVEPVMASDKRVTENVPGLYKFFYLNSKVADKTVQPREDIYIGINGLSKDQAFFVSSHGALASFCSEVNSEWNPANDYILIDGFASPTAVIFDPVTKTDEAISSLNGSAAGSSVILYSKDKNLEEYLTMIMLEKIGIHISVTVASTAETTPDTIEYCITKL